MLYKQVDDFNLQFIDIAALKRFLKKCGVLSDKKLLLCVIRRLDLDQDYRLCKEEFYDIITPTEKFTKGSLEQMKL